MGRNIRRPQDDVGYEGAEVLRFPSERRSFRPIDEATEIDAFRESLEELTVAETLAIGMLLCGRTFAEAAEGAGLSVARVELVWQRRRRL